MPRIGNLAIMGRLFGSYSVFHNQQVTAFHHYGTDPGVYAIPVSDGWSVISPATMPPDNTAAKVFENAPSIRSGLDLFGSRGRSPSRVLCCGHIRLEDERPREPFKCGLVGTRCGCRNAGAQMHCLPHETYSVVAHRHDPEFYWRDTVLYVRDTTGQTVAGDCDPPNNHVRETVAGDCDPPNNRIILSGETGGLCRMRPVGLRT